jgi:conjugal transfer pilus assembly protein TraF
VGALAQDKAIEVKKVAASSAVAVSTVSRDPFPGYSDKSRGWHFKEIVPEPEPEEAEVAPAPPPQAPPPTALNPAAPASAPGPAPLSPAWIRENMPKYLDAAIDNPSPQNVSNYMYLQKYSMDKSDQYAQAVKRVVMGDALLDENNTRPIWGGGSDAIDATAARAKDELLTTLAKNTGIWFFFRSDCEPCHTEAPVLAAFAKKYGFNVYPISMDGAPMQNSPFKSYVVDRGQSEKLGVQYTPAIYLAKPPGMIISVTQGLMSMDELASRFVELANEHGLIDDKDYKRTRGDTKDLASTKKDTAPLSALASQDPAEVRNFIRSMIQQKNPR